MNREKQNIKTTDWLIRGIPEEQLKREKREAIKEAEAELRDKQIEERMAHMMYEQAEKSGHAMSSIAKADILIAQAKRDVAEEIFAEIEEIRLRQIRKSEFFRNGSTEEMERKFYEGAEWGCRQLSHWIAELKKKYTESEKD